MSLLSRPAGHSDVLGWGPGAGAEPLEGKESSSLIHYVEETLLPTKNTHLKLLPKQIINFWHIATFYIWAIYFFFLPNTKTNLYPYKATTLVLLPLKYAARFSLWMFICITRARSMLKIHLASAKNWLIRRDPDAGKDWRQEEKRTTKDETVGWHHWLDGHEFEQVPGVGDGQGSLACYSPWGLRVRHDWATELNWITADCNIYQMNTY